MAAAGWWRRPAAACRPAGFSRRKRHRLNSPIAHLIAAQELRPAPAPRRWAASPFLQQLCRPPRGLLHDCEVDQRWGKQWKRKGATSCRQSGWRRRCWRVRFCTGGYSGPVSALPLHYTHFFFVKLGDHQATRKECGHGQCSMAASCRRHVTGRFGNEVWADEMVPRHLQFACLQPFRGHLRVRLCNMGAFREAGTRFGAGKLRDEGAAKAVPRARALWVSWIERMARNKQKGLEVAGLHRFTTACLLFAYSYC